MNESKLPTKVCVFYGLPAFALALIGITFYVYIPKYYADVVKIDLKLLGGVILLSRILDAVIDPLIGKISDRTKWKLGRRRSWMAIALLPLSLVFWLLVAPPFELTPTFGNWWFAILTLLFFIAWSLFSVPYEALAPELTFDYDERTRLLSWREGFLVIGTLMAAVIPYLLDEQFYLMGIIYVPCFLVASYLCISRVREFNWGEAADVTVPFFASIRSILQNRPFLILLLAYVVSGFGAALPATLIFFYVEYVLGSDQGSLFLLIYFGVGFIFLPVWVAFARRFEKKMAWIAAIGVNTGAFIGVLFLGPGDAFWYGILVALSGLGYGATLAIPSAIQADVIDYDEWKNGVRREGEIYGIWSVAKSLSAALGAGIAFPILDLVGYQAGAPQSELVLLTISHLYAGLPSFCNLLAILIIWRYPIDRAMFNKIRKEIEERETK